jgi:hypothetical protein
VDFTREPIIETIITPKDGYKLVVRSSKSSGQEEYFVDAVEVVAFGNAHFFRSSERPKAFLVPISDYELLEVREARMVLKNAGPDRSIKIGGGREGSLKPSREAPKQEAYEEKEAPSVEQEQSATVEASAEGRPDARLDKKKGRRHTRKRRGKDEPAEAGKEEGTPSTPPGIPALEDDKIVIPAPQEGAEESEGGTSSLPPSVLSSLLQPPPTLISETINRYRENALFKSAFFMTEEEQYKPHDKVEDLLNEDDDADFKQQHLQEPTFAPEQPFHQENEDRPLSSDTDLFLAEEGLGIPVERELEDDDFAPNTPLEQQVKDESLTSSTEETKNS